EEIHQIVDHMIAALATRLADKDMTIELSPAAKELLADRGYDPVLGARPLRRAVQREIEDQLSEKILYGDLKAGQKEVVDATGEGLLAEFIFTGVDEESSDAARELEAGEPVAAAVGAGSGDSGADEATGT